MIKKIGCFSFVSLLLGTPVQSADLGFEVGADLWRTNMTGSISSRDITAGYINIDLEKNLTMNTVNNSRYYFTFYHPIPYLPNLLLAANQIEHRGSGSAVGKDIASAFDSDINLDIDGSLNLSHFDVTAFWTPLDIELFSLDLGLTYRKFNGSMDFFVLSDSIKDPIPIRADIDNHYLLAYAKSTVYLPLTGLSASLQVNFGNNFDMDNNEQAIDTDIALQYRNWTGLGVGLGYRYFDVDLESSVQGRKTTYKLDTFGPYLSLSYRF